MRRKTIIVILIILISTIGFLIVALNTSEPHFRATRNGVEVEMKHLTIEWLDKNCKLISDDKYSCPDNHVVEFWNQFK